MSARLAQGLSPAPLLSRPLSGLPLASFVVLAAVAVVVFAASFPFARKERTVGYLTSVSGWSQVSARVDPAVSKTMRPIALEHATSLQALLVEAVNDCPIKHGKPPIA